MRALECRASGSSAQELGGALHRGDSGPAVAATDYVRALPDLIRAWVPGKYLTLGTDGFGRSDTRARAAAFFRRRCAGDRPRGGACGRVPGRVRARAAITAAICAQLFIVFPGASP